MEEDTIIKRKKIIKKTIQIISYTFIIILMIIASFLILYVITGKIAESKGEKAPFGLFTIVSPSMTPNIEVYDVIFVRKIKPESLKVGDVITFYSSNIFFGDTPITHRIIEILNVPNEELMFRVKGDANEIADEEKVLSSNIVGKVILKIPKIGRTQYFLASKSGWILAILLPTLCIISYDIYKIIKLIILKNKLEKLKE